MPAPAMCNRTKDNRNLRKNMLHIKKLLLGCLMALTLVSCGTTLSVKAWQSPSLNAPRGSVIAFYENGRFVKDNIGTDLWKESASCILELITLNNVHYIHDGYFPKVDYAIDMRFYASGNGSTRVRCCLYEGPAQFRTEVKDMAVHKVLDNDTGNLSSNCKKVAYALCPVNKTLDFSVHSAELASAVSAAKSGNWSSCESLVRAHISSHPNDAEGYYLLGVCCMYRKMYDDAYAYFNRASGINAQSRYKTAAKQAASAAKAQKVYNLTI